MIYFEDELKKFGPSMEIEEVENAVRDHELTDMIDIMFAMMRQQNDASAMQPVPAQAPAMQPAAPMTQATAMATVPPVTPAQ